MKKSLLLLAVVLSLAPAAFAGRNFTGVWSLSRQSLIASVDTVFSGAALVTIRMNVNKLTVISETPRIVDVDFHIRFYTARPVRQAIARTILLGLTKPDPEMEKTLQQFIAQKFQDDIIVAVTFDSSEARINAPLQQELIRMQFPVLQKETYLETRARKVYLTKYVPPSNNGLGAAFYFPRLDKGEPYVVPEIGDVRFYADLPGLGIILDKRFKISNFMYEGILEF